MWLILSFFILTACNHLYDRANQNPKPIKESSFSDIYTPESDDFIEEFTIQKSSKNKKLISQNFDKRVSMSVTSATNVKSAFSKVALDVGINVRFSENLNNEPITFYAKNEPIKAIIKDLCKLLNWRYKISGSNVLIENDKPYFKTYDVHFLNISRETNSFIATSSNILSTGEDASQTNNLESNGSTSVVNTNSVNNFWSELETNLTTLLNQEGALSFHKQAGLISIKTTFQIHKKIKKYLKKLKEACSAQVLIEAKILEVSLNKEFKNGIDWSSGISQKGEKEPYFSSMKLANDTAQLASDTPPNFFSAGIQKKSISSVIHFIEKFGSVRTLANPRITIMNNQTGILKVATQEVYFNIRYDNRYNGALANGNRESVYSNIKTVPVGLVFAVHPVININTGEIILTIRPTISSISEYKNDPGVSLMYSSVLNKETRSENPSFVGNMVPVIKIREMDSVLNMKSGDVIILGGMMSEKSTESRLGPPFVSKMPVLQDVASSREIENSVSEIVIFLRARIVKPGNARAVAKKDKSIYKNFAVDNRPLNFQNEKKNKKTL